MSLPLGQVEPLEHWKRENDDQDVSEDVASCVNLPKGMIPNAYGICRRTPVGRHGIAVEDGDEQL